MSGRTLLGGVLLLVGMALLAASALALLLSAGPVAQLGGSGMADVPRDGVIAEGVRLLQGGNVNSNNYNQINVRLRTASAAYDGPYTVCIESTRGSPPCQTITITTAVTTVTFNVGGGAQEASVVVRVYAAAR
ncbi:MAG: hypothetical protein QXW56_02535 [Nitrososphaerota archaeon]